MTTATCSHCPLVHQLHDYHRPLATGGENAVPRNLTKTDEKKVSGPNGTEEHDMDTKHCTKFFISKRPYG